MTAPDLKSNVKAIDAQAAEWTVRLSAAALDSDSQRELDAWLEADVRHRGALIRARAAWLDLDRLAALAALPPGQPLPDPSVKAPLSASGVTTRRTVLAASLGMLALVGGTGGWWVWRRRGGIYETDVGEIRRVTLSDGSSLLLSTSTRAVVHFDEAHRGVELVRGEGLFEVAKDPARPFIVRVGGVSVRAVGTVFAVRAVDRNVDVTVTEGVVEVADAAQGASVASQRVTADEQAVVSEAGGIQVQHVAAAEVERHLAWRDGMLSFDGEPLSEAVKEINRHNHRAIVIDDPTLGARPVVGLFRASDTQGFAATVAAALGAESSTDGDVIHLRARAAR
jgi:transmembrane sensor